MKGVCVNIQKFRCHNSDDCGVTYTIGLFLLYKRELTLIWFWEDWKWHSYSSIHPMKVSWEHRGHPSSPSSPGNWSWLPQWQQLYIFFVSVTQCNWYTKRQTMWRTKLNISIHVSVGWFIYGGSYRHCEVAARIFSRPVSRCSQAAWFCGLLHVRRGARVMFNFPHSESIPSTFGLAL
jgi:hypothetical protein